MVPRKTNGNLKFKVNRLSTVKSFKYFDKKSIWKTYTLDIPYGTKGKTRKVVAPTEISKRHSR